MHVRRYLAGKKIERTLRDRGLRGVTRHISSSWQKQHHMARGKGKQDCLYSLLHTNAVYAAPVHEQKIRFYVCHLPTDMPPTLPVSILFSPIRKHGQRQPAKGYHKSILRSVPEPSHRPITPVPFVDSAEPDPH